MESTTFATYFGLVLYIIESEKVESINILTELIFFFMQRVEMLSLASNQHDWIEISESELNQENPSYSILAARHFKETYPEAMLYWIIGNDQWKKITTWYNIAELAEIITFIVFTRDQECPLDKPEIKSHIINYNFDASSTEIREKLAERQDLIQTIDSDVYEYIKDNKLYH